MAALPLNQGILAIGMEIAYTFVLVDLLIGILNSSEPCGLESQTKGGSANLKVKNEWNPTGHSIE